MRINFQGHLRRRQTVNAPQTLAHQSPPGQKVGRICGPMKRAMASPLSWGQAAGIAVGHAVQAANQVDVDHGLCQWAKA
jgi:hypothetical protein